jgi:PleD family two-component response regulator
MKAHNMPITGLSVGRTRVIILDSNESTASALAEALRTRADYEVQVVCGNFEAGAALQKYSPHVLLISLLAEGVDAAGICRNIREDEDLQTIKIIALAGQLTEVESAALLRKGFDSYISYGAEPIELIRKIEQAIAIIY